MADNTQAESSEPQEISSQEMADIMNGSNIADEVDAPRAAKASVPTEPEEDSEEEDDGAPDLKKLAEKHLEGAEDEEDEEEDVGSVLSAGLYKKLLASTKGELETAKAEYEGRIAELEKKAGLADLSLEGLREAALAGKLSRDELIELASDLFYIAEPERADPDTKVGLERRKLSIEQKKVQEQIRAKEEEMRAQIEESERSVRRQKMEMTYTNEVSKSLDKFPHIAAAFDDDVEAISKQILSYATAVASSLPEDFKGQLPDLSAEGVLKLFEEIAEKKHNQLQSNKRLSKKKSSVPVSAPSAPKTHDEEVEEMVRIMNSYK